MTFQFRCIVVHNPLGTSLLICAKDRDAGLSFLFLGQVWLERHLSKTEVWHGIQCPYTKQHLYYTVNKSFSIFYFFYQSDWKAKVWRKNYVLTPTVEYTSSVMTASGIELLVFINIIMHDGSRINN